MMESARWHMSNYSDEHTSRNVQKVKTRLVTVIALVIAFGLGFGFNRAISTSANEQATKKVTGIGGVFFKCKDPDRLKEWYKTHLGLDTDKYGTTFEWRQGADATRKGFTQWSPFSEKTKYFEPSTKDFMINYRVENLGPLIEQLKKDGVVIADSIEAVEYGKFVHIMDLEGNKIELWEPIDDEYDKIVGGRTK